MITMLIDHLGVVLGETSKYYYICRVIGRLSMPVYAFFICEGYKHTHDKWKYTARLAAIGVSAQIGYMYIVKSFCLNICFVWVLASVWLYMYEHCKKWAIVLYSVCCGTLIFVLPFDYYGFVPFGLVLVFYFIEHIGYQCAFCLALSTYSSLQLLSVFAIPIIHLCKDKGHLRIKNKTIKMIWRSFYPIHLYILGALR